MMKLLRAIALLLPVLLCRAAFADVIYSHMPLQGAVVTCSMPFDSQFSWRARCDVCGWISRDVHNDFGTSGISRHAFTCPDCGVRRESVFVNSTRSVKAPEVGASVYFHSADGCIITEDNPFDTQFGYRVRCGGCGALSGTFSSFGSSGSSQRSYTCSKCGHRQSYALQHYTGRIRDLSTLYSHCAITGAVITEMNPFDSQFSYAPVCAGCGFRGSRTSTFGTSGASERSWSCPKCGHRQKILLENWSKRR
ncbi:MAG: hypothetical protein IK083_03205 [Abditibacteriota bacterium]|nr:hypothetical protein [Abditibacteriota bacterium]